MASNAFIHVRPRQLDPENVTVVEVLSERIDQPEIAREFGDELYSLAKSETGQPARMIVDFTHTKYMCSSGFAVLLNLWRIVDKAGGQVRICRMSPEIRFGADILHLGTMIGIDDDLSGSLSAVGG
jgi:anti-anti-sigma factor